jgi:hypothetical protein
VFSAVPSALLYNTICFPKMQVLFSNFLKKFFEGIFEGKKGCALPMERLCFPQAVLFSQTVF